MGARMLASIGAIVDACARFWWRFCLAARPWWRRWPRLPAGLRPGRRTKRILLYTGTTGFRHTDAINNGRPVVQAALEAAGYTVDWEDCDNNGGGANNCDNANKNPRVFTDENLAQLRRDPALQRLCRVGRRRPPRPAVERGPARRDHPLHPGRRRHRRPTTTRPTWPRAW